MNRLFVQYVQSGIFLNIGRVEINKFQYMITDEVKYWIDQFDQVSSFTPARSYPLRVFRGLHSLPQITCPQSITHPIPFSVSLCKQFASDWVDGLNNAVVLEFLLHPHIKHFVLDCDIEREVVVEAGNIRVLQFLYECNDIKYYLCEWTSINAT